MVRDTTGAVIKGNKRAVNRPKLRYFFLNDELHKKLNIDRANDVITTWNYPRAQLLKYNYTDTLHHHGKAFKTKQVCEMLNRSITTVEKAILNGDIEEPQFTYKIGGQRSKYQYMWSEDQVMAALKFYASVSRGRPRKDGRVVTAADLPTPREVRAMMNDEQVLFIKQGENFVPVFRAKDWN